jgi:cullin 3
VFVVISIPVSQPTWTEKSLELGSFKQGKNVLKKEPMSKEIEDNDMFYFNEGFTSKLFKIKIGTVSAQRETEPEKADTRHKVSYA